jgi:small-conductance mechanosensitive channel
VLLPLQPPVRRLVLLLAAAAAGARVLLPIARAIEARSSRRARAEVARLLRRFVLWSAALLVPLLALDAVGYENHGLLDLLWIVYDLGVLVLLVLLLARRERIDVLLPADESVLGKVSKVLAAVLRPLLVALGLWMVVMRLQGYHAHALDLLLSTAFSLAALVLVPVSATALLAAARERLSSLLHEEGRSEPERAAWRLSFNFVRWNFVVLAGVTTVLLVLVAWGIPPAQALQSARAPLPWHDPEATSPTTYGALLGAFFAFALTLVLSRYVRDMLRSVWIPTSGVEQGLGYAVAMLTSYVLLIVGSLVGFSLMNIGAPQLQWFFAFIGIGIGFGLQEIVTNFVAGIILLFERPVKVGDIVTLNGTEGRVETINIRSTTVRTRQQIDILIPNKRFITEDVTNWTYGDHVVSIDVNVGVSYGADIKLVRDVLLEAAGKHGLVLDKPPPAVRFRAFGESSLDFTLWCSIANPIDRPRIQSDLRFAIFAALKRHDIEIPFPQRDLHLRSSDLGVGGLGTASSQEGPAASS